MIHFSIVATGVIIRQCAGSEEDAQRVCNFGLNTAEYCITCKNKDGCNAADGLAAKMIAIPMLIATVLLSYQWDKIFFYQKIKCGEFLKGSYLSVFYRLFGKR